MAAENCVLHPLVWRGGGYESHDSLPTGFKTLDRYLPGGGWPRTALTEIALERYGIGELGLLMPALASLSREEARAERWIVWVAPPFLPYAPALLRHGIDLESVLLVDASAGRPKFSRDAFWAVEQAQRSGSSAAVLAWVGEASLTMLRRLQLAAEKYGCWTVLFRPVTVLQQNSPAALRIKLSHALGRTRLEIVKCRGRRPRFFDLAAADEAQDVPGA